MSYQVLARKWRPGSFHEMVGQEHVLQALINALDTQRLHHAYLFTGTRGVGKTSVARILAKCLNCEAGVSSSPCGSCSACVEIATGRFVDLLEVDAASRTKVEDTRDLLDNVQYAPAKGRFKVYLIDEVHMLSGHSFNALLKTLEEPPPHVKFLLATTDPQKLPATILSRCLQFSLKNLPPQQIVEHLQSILESEKIECDNRALWHIARTAAGSMRDALSLTDQAVAYCGARLEEADVRQMLGSIDHSKILELVDALCAQDAAAILALIATLDEHAPDYESLLSELLAVLHQLALLQAVPEYHNDSSIYAEQLPAIAARLSAEDVQLYYQIGLLGVRDMPYAPDPRSGFEMSLLRMLAFRPDSGNGADEAVEPAKKKPRNLTANIAQETATPPRAAINAAQPTKPLTGKGPLKTGVPAVPPEAVVATKRLKPAVVQEKLKPIDSRKPLTAADSGKSSKTAHAGKPLKAAVAADALQTPAQESRCGTPDMGETSKLKTLNAPHWLQLCEQLPLHGMAKNVAANCILQKNSAGHLQFSLDSDNCHIFKPTHQQQIQQALRRYFGEAALQVSIKAGQIDSETPLQYSERKQRERQQQAVDSILTDPHVNALIDKFDASVIMESIKPGTAGE